MNDKEFSELQLRMMIVPHQVKWPSPDYLHWQRLHEAANEARARVSKFYTVADEIDRNANLSRDDKHHQRSKAADEAIADFEASKTLARAHQAVQLAVAKQDVSPEITQDSEDMLKALKDVERGWRRAMDKIAERTVQTKAPSGIRRGALISGRI